MLQVDPKSYKTDPFTGKRKKQVQLPIRQLTLINELKRKINEDWNKKEYKILMESVAKKQLGANEKNSSNDLIAKKIKCSFFQYLIKFSI